MDRLAWEQHAMRHSELLRIAEANQVRNIAISRMWRQRRDRALHLLQRMMTVFHKRRFGGYNQPSASVQTHRVVRRFHSTTEL
jgi:hypothetical protein